MRYLEKYSDSLHTYHFPEAPLNILLSEERLPLDKFLANLDDAIHLLKQRGLSILFRHSLPKLLNKFESYYQELNQMVLSSEENLENVKKLESLLRFDFTLTNQIITYNFLKPSYYDFFNLFLYWFDFPVQSLLLRGLRYFLDYKDYDSDIESILTSLAETCHDVLSRVEPKSLKKENLKDLEKVIEELNNEILGMLKGLKGFNGLQISEANWWENEALKKIKKLFNELSGEKEFHEKKILVAFKISIYLQLSSLIQGKNKLFYDTLFGMLTFLKKARQLSLITKRNELKIDCIKKYIYIGLLEEGENQWQSGIFDVMDVYLRSYYKSRVHHRSAARFSQEYSELIFEEFDFEEFEGSDCIDLMSMLEQKMNRVIFKESNPVLLDKKSCQKFYEELSKNIDSKRLNPGTLLKQICSDPKSNMGILKSTKGAINNFFKKSLELSQERYELLFLECIDIELGKFLNDESGEFETLAKYWFNMDFRCIFYFGKEKLRKKYDFEKQFQNFLDVKGLFNHPNMKKMFTRSPETIPFVLNICDFVKTMKKKSKWDFETDYKLPLELYLSLKPSLKSFNEAHKTNYMAAFFTSSDYASGSKILLQKMIEYHVNNFADLKVDGIKWSEWLYKESKFKKYYENLLKILKKILTEGITKIEEYYSVLIGVCQSPENFNPNAIPCELIKILRGPVRFAAYILKQTYIREKPTGKYVEIQDLILKIMLHPINVLIPDTILYEEVLRKCFFGIFFHKNSSSEFINNFMQQIYQVYYQNFGKCHKLEYSKSDWTFIQGLPFRIEEYVFKPRISNVETYEFAWAVRMIDLFRVSLKNRPKKTFIGITYETLLPGSMKYFLDANCSLLSKLDPKSKNFESEFLDWQSFGQRMIGNFHSVVLELIHSRADEDFKIEKKNLFFGYYKRILEVLPRILEKNPHMHIFVKAALFHCGFSCLNDSISYYEPIQTSLVSHLSDLFIQIGKLRNNTPKSDPTYSFVIDTHELCMKIFKWFHFMSKDLNKFFDFSMIEYMLDYTQNVSSAGFIKDEVKKIKEGKGPRSEQRIRYNNRENRWDEGGIGDGINFEWEPPLRREISERGGERDGERGRREEREETDDVESDPMSWIIKLFKEMEQIEGSLKRSPIIRSIHERLRKKFIKTGKWSVSEIRTLFNKGFQEFFVEEYEIKIATIYEEMVHMVGYLSKKYDFLNIESYYRENIYSKPDKQELKKNLEPFEEELSVKTIHKLSVKVTELISNIENVCQEYKEIIKAEGIKLIIEFLIEFYKKEAKKLTYTEKSCIDLKNFVEVVLRLYVIYIKEILQSNSSTENQLFLHFTEMTSDFLNLTKDFSIDTEDLFNKIFSLLIEQMNSNESLRSNIVDLTINYLALPLNEEGNKLVEILINDLIKNARKSIPDLVLLELRLKEQMDKENSNKLIITEDLLSEFDWDAPDTLIKSLEILGKINFTVAEEGSEINFARNEIDPNRLKSTGADVFSSLKEVISSDTKIFIMRIIELIVNMSFNQSKLIKLDPSKNPHQKFYMLSEITIALFKVISNFRYLLPYTLCTPISQEFLEKLNIPTDNYAFELFGFLVEQKKPITLIEVIFYILIPVEPLNFIPVVKNLFMPEIIESRYLDFDLLQQKSLSIISDIVDGFHKKDSHQTYDILKSYLKCMIYIAKAPLRTNYSTETVSFLLEYHCKIQKHTGQHLSFEFIDDVLIDFNDFEYDKSKYSAIVKRGTEITGPKLEIPNKVFAFEEIASQQTNQVKLVNFELLFKSFARTNEFEKFEEFYIQETSECQRDLNYHEDHRRNNSRRNEQNPDEDNYRRNAEEIFRDRTNANLFNFVNTEKETNPSKWEELIKFLTENKEKFSKGLEVSTPVLKANENEETKSHHFTEITTIKNNPEEQLAQNEPNNIIKPPKEFLLSEENKTSTDKETPKTSSEVKKIEKAKRSPFSYFIGEPVYSLEYFKSLVKRYSNERKVAIEILTTTKLFQEKERDNLITKEFFHKALKNKSLLERSSILMALESSTNITLHENLKEELSEVREEYNKIINSWHLYSKEYPTSPSETANIKDPDNIDNLFREFGVSISNQGQSYALSSTEFEFSTEQTDLEDFQWVRTTFSEAQEPIKVAKEEKLPKSLVESLKSSYLYSEEQLFLLVEVLIDTFSIDSFIYLLQNPLNEIRFVDLMILLLHRPELLKEKFDKISQEEEEDERHYTVYQRKFLEYLTYNFETFMSLEVKYLSLYNGDKLKALKNEHNWSAIIEGATTVFDLLIKLILDDDESLSSMVIDHLAESQRIMNDSGKSFKIPFSHSIFHQLMEKSNFAPQKLEFLFKQMLKSSPDYFVSEYGFVTNFLYPKLLTIAEQASKGTKFIKENMATQGTVDVYEVFNYFSLEELNIILLAYRAIIQNYLSVLFESKLLHHTSGESQFKVTQEMFLKTQDFMNKQVEDLQKPEFYNSILEIFNLLDQFAKINMDTIGHEVLNSLISIAMLMGSNIHLKKKFDSENIHDLKIVKLTMVKSQEPKEEEIALPGLVKNFSKLGQEEKKDLLGVFTNFAAKYQNAIRGNPIFIESDNPELFILINSFPWLFKIENKVSFLVSQILGVNGDEHYGDRRSVYINREYLVFSFANSLNNLSKKDLLKNIKVHYDGEIGSDAGGLRKELFTLTTKYIFDPSYGLFRHTANKTTLEISPFSSIIPNYLKLFEFAGIVLGKAILDNIPINVNLNRALLKYLLGAHIVINDLEDIDQSLASAMDWIINNDPSDLCCTFTYEYKDLFGEMITLELIKDGANLDIKENNKIKYVKLFCEMVMIKNVKPQMDAFTRGFRTILPKRYLNLFKPQDLQLMISGVPNIDVEEMIAHLLFDNHAYYNSEYHKFLVEILREYSADQLTLFLQFVTCKFSKSLTRVPIGGFKEQPITIRVMEGDTSRLPVAHTCSRYIDLPKYPTKEIMKEKLNYAYYTLESGFYIG